MLRSVVYADRPNDAPVVFQLVRPPVQTSRRPSLAWLIGLVIGILLGREIGGVFVPPVIGAVIGGIIGVIIVAWRQRQRADDRPLGAIVFERGEVTLPRDAFSRKTDRIGVREILSIEEVGRRYGALLLRTKSRMYNYPVAVLGGPASVRALRDEVLYRIASEPDGEALIAALVQREGTADRLFAQKPHATRVVLGAIALVFLLATALGAYKDSLDGSVILMRMGASIPDYVREGEWYRLFTANLLHGGTVHIGFNGLAILGLGYIVERLMGTPRFLVLYLVTGVTGTLASVFFSGAMLSVGASTSVFGLFVAWGYLSLRYNARLPAGFAVTNFQWGVLAFNFALPLFLPFIDGWGHAGGALGGVLAAAVMYPSASSFERPWGSRRVWWGVAGALIAAYVAAAVFVFVRDRGDPIRRIDFARLMLRSERVDPGSLNNLAWGFAIDRATTREEIEVAEALIERSLREWDRDRGLSTPLDTQATVVFRAGRAREAVDIELAAIRSLASDDDKMGRVADQVAELQGGDDHVTVFHAQLHRFLEAAEGYGLAPTDTATVTALKQGVHVEVPRGGTWYFGVHVTSAKRGLLVVALPDRGPTKIPIVARLPSHPRFELLGFADDRPEHEEGAYFARSAEIDALPGPLP